MTFWNRVGGGVAPAGGGVPEAGLACAILALGLNGAFTDLEPRLLSAFRDEFEPLTRLKENDFQAAMQRAHDVVINANGIQNPRAFLQNYVLPVLTNPSDRFNAYRYAYAMIMINLNVEPAEQQFLNEMKAAFALDPITAQQAEKSILEEFATLHRAISCATLGLMVIAADGNIVQAELDDLKQQRTLLSPIAKLDDTQFDLVYDMAVGVYNRYLMDANNLRIFLYNVIAPRLDTRDMRTQAFHYVASISTSDAALTTVEINMMKDILAALQLSDQSGEAIFEMYMKRVRTIDGQPVQ
jgi:hypothetical protein